MKQTFIQQNHTPQLILFFAGWGMDTTPFQHLNTDGRDVLLCSDYRTLDFDEELCHGYQSITLVAWSMGVWAATQVLQNSALPLVKRIAINGTPYPIDPCRGISPQTIEGTLTGLTAETVRKFQRRMCGSSAAFQEFLAVAPARAVSELHEELQAIITQEATLPESTFSWDTAIIGGADRIFLPEKQRRAWQVGVQVIETSDAHYADTLFQIDRWESFTKHESHSLNSDQ